MSEYGVRIYSEKFKKMKWGEFAALLEGLSADSPLGRIVQIRLEDDQKMLERFTPAQRRIRLKWHEKVAMNMSLEERDRAVEQFRRIFFDMAAS